ncbi:MAG: putative esterase [Verrucomicrobiales bacterium]|nr:putative esterase [Verrucomicrobiales bacterium]
MRFLFSAFTLLLFVSLASGQNRTSVVSPEIDSGDKVTFRLVAPKANDVTIYGDWMPLGSTEKMAKDAGGTWSITLGSIAPGLYIYNFNVDGMAIADPINPKMKLRARTSASILELPGKGGELWEPGDVPHGTIEIINHKSTVINGETRQFYVYLPPSYEKNKSANYPILYLLHGSNDTPAGWTTMGRANFIMDNLVARKEAREMIIIMPFGHAVAFGTPGNNNALFEKYLLEEVMPLAEKKYRVAHGRENRAVVGLSMGGGHSLGIGLGHLDLFSAVGAFSSAVPGDFEKRFQGLLDEPERTNKKLNLLWIGCGRQDPGFANSQRLSNLLITHKIQHTFHPTEGAHTYTVWRQYFSEVAPLLFQKKTSAK